MTDEIVQTLVKQYINRWTTQRGQSLQSLAEITTIDYKTIYRYSRGRSVPGVDSFLRLCEVICNFNEAVAILDHISPAAAKLFRIWKNPEATNRAGIANVVAKNQFDFWIYGFCTKNFGTTHGEIKEKFGDQGLASLDKLFAIGAVTTKNGRILALENDTIVNEQTNRLAITHLLELCPEKCIDNHLATRYWQVQGINEHTAIFLARKIRILEEEIKQAIDNPENFGEITWVFTMVSDTATPPNLLKGAVH